MLVTSRSIAYSQTTSDSLKCFTYSEARKILTDLRQLPLKDSIINRFDSIVKKDSIIIQMQDVKITEQRLSIQLKEAQVVKIKKRSKFFIIFGGLLGLATQLIF